MTDPVLIVGAGPTGLAAALELSRFGVAVRLVDKASAPATTSRAIGVQARTLELLQQRGLAATLVRQGHPAHGASVYGGGKRILRLDFGHLDSRYAYLLFISQAETERILAEAVGRQGVTIERGVELIGLAQDAPSHGASPVAATLRHADGSVEQIRAPWLISAEGAHSLIRTTLDLRFEGKTLQEEYALGDLHVAGDLPEDDVHIFSSEHGFMGLFPMGGGRFRLIAGQAEAGMSEQGMSGQGMSGQGTPEQGTVEPGTAPSLETLRRIYDQRSPIPARLHDLVWSSWFRINSRMVPRLKVGRFLLGGDAAHIHSPAGAQGMNTGIQDMINLGWKLALVVQGKAPEALLDTYEQDRLPIMRELLSMTERLTWLIGSENHLLRAMVNHLGPAIGGSEMVQENRAAWIGQLALNYRASPLSSRHSALGRLRAGDRVPDLMVRHGGHERWSQSDLLGLLDPCRFTLLVTHADEAETLDPALREAARHYGDLLTIVELAPPADGPAGDAYRAAFGRRSGVVLVRPDGYAGLTSTGDAAPGHLADYRTHWLTPAPTSP